MGRPRKNPVTETGVETQIGIEDAVPKSTAKAGITRKMPASENGPGVRCTTKTGDEYIISQCFIPRRFTLWQVVSGGYRKIATADTPTELYEKISWETNK